MRSFCECESCACKHRGQTCKSTKRLALFRVAGLRQTLCPECAEIAEEYCDAYGYTLEKLTESGSRRASWHVSDWVCAGVLLAAVIVLVIEILPAFLDGRVAQVVGR